MKKQFLLTGIIGIFILCLVITGIYFFNNKNNTTPAITSTQNHSKYTKEEIAKIEKENEQLKQDKEKLQKDYDNLKKNYDDLTQKYYEAVPTAFFTFDDGPSANTEKILEILRQNNVKATFFVVGTPTSFRAKMYKQIADEGHTVGIHSYYHDYKKMYASEDAFLDDLNLIESYVKNNIGYKPAFYRFPGGSNNSYLKPELYEVLAKDLKDRGYEFFDWNVASGDTAQVTPPKDFIVNNVINGCKERLKLKKKNAVILMHDAAAKKTTPLALAEIIPAVKNMGYKIEPLTSEAMAVHFPEKKKKPVA